MGRDRDESFHGPIVPSGMLQSSLVARTEGLDQQVDWNW